ncbi:hypothetical protein BCY86_08920 [Pajaroellobacter abortibovis]|uniref:Uncharacterized protein n=1 Tax=Pajaroellobacter abortibovis TaxID=1882918 RepID=A0A1L6MZ54_9BACT|nr:hypothetical protein BCY86_08920 [Pajaroellobacter abortibovis]
MGVLAMILLMLLPLVPIFKSVGDDPSPGIFQSKEGSRNLECVWMTKQKFMICILIECLSQILEGCQLGEIRSRVRGAIPSLWGKSRTR